MNRREFGACSIAAFVVGARMASGAPAAANSAADSPAKQLYRYRFRYAREENVFKFWMRASRMNDLAAIVPISLIFSSDIGARNVIHQTNHVARDSDFHIIRGEVTIAEGAWQTGSPLFCRLQIGDERVPSKVYTLWKGSPQA
jgi:hypothetical protein